VKKRFMLDTNKEDELQRKEDERIAALDAKIAALLCCHKVSWPPRESWRIAVSSFSIQKP